MTRTTNNDSLGTEAVHIELGRRISAYLDAEDISRRRFAKMVGIDRTLLSEIEAGRGNPTLNTLIEIADGLNIDISLLFQGNPSSEDVQYEIVPFPEKR